MKTVYYEVVLMGFNGEPFISRKYSADLDEAEAIRRANKYAKKKKRPIYKLSKIETTETFIIHELPF